MAARGMILAALVNAMLLLLAVGGIAIKGIRRLSEPAEVASATVMAVATAGIVVNGVTASCHKFKHSTDLLK